MKPEKKYLHKLHFLNVNDTLDEVHGYVEQTAAWICENADIFKSKQAKPNVLDVGASDGYMGIALRKYHPNAQYLGIDPSPDSDDVYPSTLPRLPQRLIRKYDMVIYNHVFEHIQHPEWELAVATKLVAYDGYIFIAVPHGSSPWAYEYEGHITVFYPQTITRMMERVGLNVIKQVEKCFRRDCVELWTLARRVDA